MCDDLVTFLVQMHYRRVDSELAGLDPDDRYEADPYMPSEHWSMRMFGRLGFDPEEDAAIMVPHNDDVERIYARRSDGVFMTFARDWFHTSELSNEQIYELGGELFSHYRPKGISEGIDP